MNKLPPTAVAGAVAGSVALLAFVALHAVWIVPIWAMLWMLPLAAFIGALAAWPFDGLAGGGSLPPAPFDGITFSAVLLATLVPTAVVGVLVGPVDRDHISVPAVLLPLLLAAPAGGAIGGESPRQPSSIAWSRTDTRPSQPCCRNSHQETLAVCTVPGFGVLED